MRTLAFLSIIFLSTKSFAQDLSNDSLLVEISRMDSLLFKVVNTCDTTAYKNFFTTNLEFYHDKGGLTLFVDELKSIKERCKAGIQIRRVLIPGSLKVYPIRNYGAIEEGKHTFYFTEPGKQEIFAGTFKFIHIWKFENKTWKISRVISYDH